MKVNGQLEDAGLEQIAAATTLPASRGRMYMDISSPGAGVERIYDGTNWKQVAWTTDIASTVMISQNSGKAVTVDWSTGLFQKVILTDNAIISFSNPQANKIHRLTIVQVVYNAATPSLFQYRLNVPDQVNDKNSSVNNAFYNDLGSVANQDGIMFTWYYQVAIGTAYATIPAALAIPATLTATAVTGMALSAWGDILYYGTGATPFGLEHRLYHFGQKLFISAGGITAAATAAARVVGSTFLQSGGATIVASGTSPFIQAFGHDAINEPIGAAYANPATLPAGAGQCIDSHPNGLYVAIGHTTTPFMSVYPFSSAGFGVKLTNPVTLPAAQVNSVAFSPLGDFLAVASQTTPFIQVYAFNPTTGVIGAIASNPAVLPAGGPPGSIGHGIAWSAKGDFIAMAMSTTPFLYVIAFDRTTGTFGASQVGAGLASANAVTFTPDGNYLFVGQNTTPFLTGYDWTGSTLSIPLAFDGSAPAVAVNDLLVHPNNKTLFVGLNVAPFLAAYPLPNKTRNYLRI